MSRRGNCWDNAVAESFFGSLKKERIKKQDLQEPGNSRSLTCPTTSSASRLHRVLLQAHASPQSFRRGES
jgi:transposase InsO family protein